MFYSVSLDGGPSGRLSVAVSATFQRCDSPAGAASRIPSASHTLTSIQDGPEEIRTPPHAAFNSRLFAGRIHPAQQPESQVFCKPDREGPHRPEALVRTCRPEQSGAEPEGLRRLPGVPRGRHGRPRCVLRSLLLPAHETPLDEVCAVAAARGAVLSARGAPGPAREPGGGREVGSRRSRTLCPATAPRRR